MIIVSEKSTTIIDEKTGEQSKIYTVPNNQVVVHDINNPHSAIDILRVDDNLPAETLEKFAKTVVYPDNMKYDEATQLIQQWVNDMLEERGEDISTLTSCAIVISIDEKNPQYVNIDKDESKAPAIERIRRITGYLVGTVDRWNNGKSAELRDRVKHDIEREI